MATGHLGYSANHQLRWRGRLVRSIAKVRADISFAIVDAFLIVIGYMAALGLRSFDIVEGVNPAYWDRMLRFLPIVVVTYLVTNMIFGGYGHIWEYASFAEARKVVWAVATATAILFVASSVYSTVANTAVPIPRSVIVMGGLVVLVGMGAVRFRSRLFALRRINVHQLRERTLVVGTGESAYALARSSGGSSSTFDVIGFVNVHRGSTSRHLAGRPIYGGVDDLPDLIEQLDIARVIVAAGQQQEIARKVLDLCMQSDVHLSTMPDLGTLNRSANGFRDVRDLELEDLLERPQVSIDLDEVADTLRGKRVMVTGAGGSIGSELARQIMGYGPEALIALDHDETHLHDAALTWGAGAEVVPTLCDIRDTVQLRRVMRSTQPQVIFHAAAHKHVPILETFPGEAVKTNVMGTHNVIEVATQECDLELFLLISTDKAVDPACSMGATKRIAEMIVQARAATTSDTEFAAVRFGNVLGSRGSVVPTFISQVKSGGPVTVTDPDMTRYFMTVREAVTLVLQAAALADSGEVFVLDMGEPIRIADLARRLIRLAGLVPNRDIDVVTIGKRPGEKMTELLSLEPLLVSRHPKIGIARPTRPGPATIYDLVQLLEDAAAHFPADELRQLLLEVTHSKWSDREIVDLRLGQEAKAVDTPRLA